MLLHSLTLEAFDKTRDICYEQPQLVTPPRCIIQSAPFESPNPLDRPSPWVAQSPSPSLHRPSPWATPVRLSSPHRASQWLAGGRNLASRASSRASTSTRRTSNYRTSNYRPVIGAPSDFRKVQQAERFQPLELSFYRAGNELPALPLFYEDINEDEQGQEYPTQLLYHARSDSMLSRFSIARKPLGSLRPLSLDATNRSYADELKFALGSRSTCRRTSIATNQSTRDFLETLDARMPKALPRSRPKSGPEPVYTLYRRASEQSLRLRTHLEEREKIERQSPECGTILEETHSSESSRKFSDLSPISSHSDPTKDLPQQYPQPHFRHDSSQSVTGHTPAAHHQSQASFHKLLDSNPFPSPPSTAPGSSARARISQWLSRSHTSSFRSLSGTSLPSCPHEHDVRRSSTTTRDRTSTVSTSSTSSNSAGDLGTPWTTPRSSPWKMRSRGSFSSSQTGPFSSSQRINFWEEQEGASPVIPFGIGVAI